MENVVELNQTIEEMAREFVDRMRKIENEISLLNDDKKNLIEEYKNKLDVKTLILALRVLKIERKVSHKSTYDTLKLALEDVVTIDD